MSVGNVPNQSLLDAIVESSDDAIVSKGLDSVITSWNRSAEKMFGHSATEAIGRSVTMIIPRERIAEETAILSRIVLGEKVEHFETERVTKDGRLIPVSLTISPVRDADGTIVGASKVARDISDRKAAENHQRLLTAELDHRVKNMLALVLSIASQTRHSSNTLEGFFSAFESRVIGLAQVHAVLSRFRWRGTSLRDLADCILLPMRTDSSRFEFGGCDVALSPNESIGVAMVLQELATNAIKHGSFRNELGKVHLHWTRVQGELLAHGEDVEVIWKETGGPTIVPSNRVGYGTQLCDLIIKGDLRGRVTREFTPEGLECILRFPLNSTTNDRSIGGGA